MAATVVKSKKLEVIGSRYFSDTQKIYTDQPATDFDGNKLRNTFGWPMLLDEIRIEVSAGGGAAGQLPISAVPLSIRISAGKRKLHRTMTPVMLTCKPNDRILTNPMFPGIGPNASVEIGGISWRLDKPLTLMPGEGLDVAMQSPPLQPDLGSSNEPDHYRVSVTGIGRLVKEAPARRWTPFVSAWIPPYAQASTIGAAPVVVGSVAAELYNPFPTPLFVKDVLGFATAYSSNPVDEGFNFSNATQNVNDGKLLGLAAEGTYVQVVNAGAFANGKKSAVNTGIRDYVPFYHAFLPMTRSWRMNAILQPRSHLQARFKAQNWNGILSEISIDPTQLFARFAISLIGYAQDT